MFNTLWYDTLIKPAFTPPSWVFAPAWIFLYATMLASIIIYTVSFSYTSKLKGYLFFVAQLVLNLLWSPIFFGMKNMILGVVIIILMDIFAFITIKLFYKVSKLAGWLLIPYFVWILFATYLNIGFVLLN